MPKKTPKKPVFVEDLPKSLEVKAGKTAIIDCVCEGEPEPDVDWYFEGKIVKDEGRFRYLFEKDDVIGLEIKKVTAADEGEYKLEAFNKSGKISATCELLVNDPSAKPAPKKEEPKNDAVVDKESFDKKAAGRIFKPANKKSKSKLPVDRENIKAENPEKYYEFGDEIGKGKFSVVREATNKKTGQKYAAKIIKFDADSLKFAIREYDVMTSNKMDNKALAQLHEAYLVRKYLILIMDLVDGKTLLDMVSHKHSLTEDDIANIVRQLCECLAYMHSKNVVHLDIRPTNIRFQSGRDLKLLDYNSARIVANKKAGEVVDVIGDTEFCAPELLTFDPVGPGSDMWSVGVITYILLSGISPFYYEDEDQVILSVSKVKWSFDEDAFETVTSEAKDFIKSCFVRIPENRLSAEAALKHKWLSNDYARARKSSSISPQDVMEETDIRLYGEEEEDYIIASLVFRTYDEEEYESPESSEEESD